MEGHGNSEAGAVGMANQDDPVELGSGAEGRGQVLLLPVADGVDDLVDDLRLEGRLYHSKDIVRAGRRSRAKPVDGQRVPTLRRGSTPANRTRPCVRSMTTTP